jgi:hypothetical protein
MLRARFIGIAGIVLLVLGACWWVLQEDTHGSNASVDVVRAPQDVRTRMTAREAP